MNLLDKMRESKNFSESEQHITEYLLGDPEPNLTIGALAQKTYTSNATIIRFCRKLGYKGFREFRTAFIKEIEADKYQSSEVNYNVPFAHKVGVRDMIRQMGSLYKESVDLCISQIREEEIREICDVMRLARRIYIYAVGDSLIAAKAFANRMVLLDKYIIFPYDNGDDFADSYNITSDDCVLFMSYGFKSSRFKRTFPVVRRCTKNIITITGNEEHPVTRNSRYKIVVSPKEEKRKISTFYSQFVFEFILNLLYSMIFQEDFEKNIEKRGRIDELSNV